MNQNTYEIDVKFKKYFEKCLFVVHNLRFAEVLKKKRVDDKYFYEIKTSAKDDIVNMLPCVPEEKAISNETVEELITTFLETEREKNGIVTISFGKKNIKNLYEALCADERCVGICDLWADNYLIGLVNKDNVFVVRINKTEMEEIEVPYFGMYKGFYGIEDTRLLDRLNEKYENWVMNDFELSPLST